MTASELIVTLAGLAAIAWVYWYFFVAARPAAVVAAAVEGGGPQTVTIAVHGGYDPAEVRVRAGRPVRLEFRREETNPCSEELVFPDFGLRRYLPAHETTTIDLPPQQPGAHEFTCGMGMLHGRLVVER